MGPSVGFAERLYCRNVEVRKKFEECDRRLMKERQSSLANLSRIEIQVPNVLTAAAAAAAARRLIAEILWSSQVMNPSSNGGRRTNALE
jgi:hypothetical protein